MLDCVIQLPNDIFYNTGIATYIWILSSKKPGHRKGKVQLINASEFYNKMRKNLGSKRNELSREHINHITKLYGDFVENEYSKIYENDFFGYRKVTLSLGIEAYTNDKGKLVNKAIVDTENIPLLENVGDYMSREVIPFSPKAKILESKTKIGYEISFTKYFYKYQEPRKIEDIMNEILELDRKLDGVLKELQEDE